MVNDKILTSVWRDGSLLISVVVPPGVIDAGHYEALVVAAGDAIC